jgi:uncharacterized membrane protein
MTDDGRRTTDHGRRTTDDGPRTTDRELRSADEIVQEALRRQAAGLSAMPPERVSLSPPERRAVLAADRFIYWLGHHWLAIANLLALLYVGVPFLAPVLMRAGLERPARAIYAFYTPLCHQLPFRSWYLFGAQPTYTQAELALRFPDEPLLPHTLIGDPVLGYKVALCQRDTAIYGAITLSGLGYALLRRRVKPLPFWAYALFGVLPIALDGGLQYVSYVTAYFFPRLGFPTLESTPVRRVITGCLFGLATVWMAYPYVEAAFDDILKVLEQRFEQKSSA